MADAKNGKGGFKEFAQHEKAPADKTAPLGPSQSAKPAPIAGTPVAKPDIAPAVRAKK